MQYGCQKSQWAVIQQGTTNTTTLDDLPHLLTVCGNSNCIVEVDLPQFTIRIVDGTQPPPELGTVGLFLPREALKVRIAVSGPLPILMVLR